MKNLTYATCLVLFMLSVVSCGNTTAQSVSRVSSTPFVVDSTLQIKNIQDLRIIEHSLYLTYDYVGGYGHQMLCSYDIDYNNTLLKFRKTFFREENNYYSIFAPVSFWLFAPTDSLFAPVLALFGLLSCPSILYSFCPSHCLKPQPLLICILLFFIVCNQ